jgi:hypothetical protein
VPARAWWFESTRRHRHTPHDDALKRSPAPLARCAPQRVVAYVAQRAGDMRVGQHKRAASSAAEQLLYTQKVGGSNPSPPTLSSFTVAHLPPPSTRASPHSLYANLPIYLSPTSSRFSAASACRQRWRPFIPNTSASPLH